MGSAALKRDKHTTDFDKKNDLLRRIGSPVSPLSFYEDLFQDNFDQPHHYITSDSKTRIRTAANMDELMQLSIFRDDIYVAPCSFFCKIGIGTLHKIYAYVVDLDHVSPAMLTRIINGKFLGLTPTYIGNSGNGIHMYYVFDAPIDAYTGRKQFLKNVYNNLKEVFRADGADLKTTLIQNYRVAGSQTKFGRTTTVFKTGKKWNLGSMADAVNVEIPQIPKVEKDPVQNVAKKKNVISFPTGRAGFYGHVLSRMDEVKEGHRESALFAMCVIAYKSRIKREDVKSDLRNVFDAMNARSSDPLDESELEKAFNGYQIKYVRTRSSKLEAWLGIKFPRNTKRNGRNQHEHLKIARSKRNDHQRDTKCSAIESYLLEHPSASNRQISKDLHMHMQTVAKYRRTIDAAGSSGGVSSIAFSTSPVGGALPFPQNQKQQQHVVAFFDLLDYGGGAAVNVPGGIPSGNPDGACTPAPPQDDLHEICEWDPGP